MYNFGVKFFIFAFAFAFMFSPLVGYATLGIDTIDLYITPTDESYLIYPDDLVDSTDNVSILPETGKDKKNCIIIKYKWVKKVKKFDKIVKVECPEKKKPKATPVKSKIKLNSPTPTKKFIAKKVAYKPKSQIASSCPFVATDYSTSKYSCSQGPYGKSSHSCNKNSPGYYALDLTGSGYGVAPEHGTINFYGENNQGTGNCTKCVYNGKKICLNTIKLKGDSGQTYVYTHMILYGGISSGQTVDKGQIIGQTYSPSKLEQDSYCSTGTHLDFSIIVDGARVSNIKSIYEGLCNVTINCTEDNKCK
jgi:murein DD-endopeptidase MepM/ murein hydrolase activator NlpD